MKNTCLRIVCGVMAMLPWAVCAEGIYTINDNQLKRETENEKLYLDFKNQQKAMNTRQIPLRNGSYDTSSDDPEKVMLHRKKEIVRGNFMKASIPIHIPMQ